MTAIALNLEHIVYITTLKVNSDDEVHLSRKSHIVYLKIDEAPTKNSSKYANFTDVF